MKWPTIYLGNVAKIQTGKSNKEDAVPDGYYVFFDRSKIVQRSNRFLLDAEAVIVPGEGSEFMPRYYRGRFDLHQRVYAITDFRGVDGKFLYYVMRWKHRYFTQVAIGSTVKSLRKGMFERFCFDCPLLPTQRYISSMLSAYDDLIENNRRRIALLEKAVRLVYREWFIHLRFPGHEQTEIKAGIPNRWKRGRIDDVCKTVGGGTPSTRRPEYWDGDVTWVVPTDVTSNDSIFLVDSARRITEMGLLESSAKIVPAYTILMTSRASVGYFALMDREVCTNQGFINIVSDDTRMTMYLLFNLINRVAEIRSNATGTTYPELSKGRFRTMDVVIPDESIIARFADFAWDVVRQIRTLKRSSRQLAQARDLLLPRLMSGRIAT